MYRGHRVAVVMPAYNVEQYLISAIVAIPRFVDNVVVVDDASEDQTSELLRATMTQSLRSTVRVPKVELIRHPHNCGVGAAIATGYRTAISRGATIIAVMAGDGQMDGKDLAALLDPIVDGRADYSKGNRFQHPDIWRTMPPSRLVGSIILSLLTRCVSGYYHIFDSQCGYTAATRSLIRRLDGNFFSRYGYPNDLLARLQPFGARVVDVCVRPIYDGQPSGMRIPRLIGPILAVLVRAMVRRIYLQYIAKRWLRLRRRAPAEL